MGSLKNAMDFQKELDQDLQTNYIEEGQMSSKLYTQAVQNKTVSGIGATVFKILCDNADITVGELAQSYSVWYGHKARGELSKRVSDLRNAGLIKVTGQRICSATGKKVNTWSVTGKTTKDVSLSLAKSGTPNKDLTLAGAVASGHISSMTSHLSFSDTVVLINLAKGCQIIIDLKAQKYFGRLVPARLVDNAHMVLNILNKIIGQARSARVY